MFLQRSRTSFQTHKCKITRHFFSNFFSQTNPLHERACAIKVSQWTSLWGRCGGAKTLNTSSLRGQQVFASSATWSVGPARSRALPSCLEIRGFPRCFFSTLVEIHHIYLPSPAYTYKHSGHTDGGTT